MGEKVWESEEPFNSRSFLLSINSKLSNGGE